MSRAAGEEGEPAEVGGEVVFNTELANGLQVDVMVGGKPGAADVAVCAVGRDGRLDELARDLLAALPPTQLSLAVRDAPVLVTAVRPRALVVRLTDAPADYAAIAQWLSSALPRLTDEPVRSLFVPLSAADASPSSSAVAGWLGLLGGLDPDRIPNAALSAPDREAGQRVADVLATLLRPSVSIAPGDWEPHALEALRLAQSLTRGGVVGPVQILRAAASVPGAGAFEALRSLIPIPRVAPGEDGSPAGSFSRPLLKQLAYAQHPTGGTPVRRVWGRDLVTAALLAGTGEQGKFVHSLGTSLGDLRDRWYAYLVSDNRGRSREEWDAWWAFAGVPLPRAATGSARLGGAATAVRREEHAGFAADAYTGTDLLGINRDVNALAALIASHRTELPLAVGLFGDWGSGKSFFMRHLQGRVRALADAAARSELPVRQVAYWKRIAQIEFNAWHYSDGKIWPSLVQHIFENLRTSKDDDEQTLQRRRDVLIEQITQDEAALATSGESLWALEVQREAAAKKIEDIKAAQQKEQEALANKLSVSVVVEATKRSLALDPVVEQQAQEALEAVGGKALGKSAEDLEVALRSARDELSGIGGLLLELIQPKDRKSKILGLLLVLIVPLVAGVLLRHGLADWKKSWADPSSFIVGAISFMGLARSWVNKRLQWLKKMRERLAAAKKEVDGALAQERQELAARQATELLEHVRALEARRDEEAAAQAEKKELDDRIAAARHELEGTRSKYRLNAFIQERAESHDYRKHLGMMALVRQDFDRLSTLIARSNREELEADAGPAGGSDTINRIVLYIDDLDRCDEETVASVLKAVHLLLAMPLFVVVVAVDPRWLARCLRRRYPELLAEDDERPHAAGGAQDRANGERRPSSRAADDVPGATALDYLEKIFQIPISLRPIVPESRARVVQTLLSVVDRRAQRPRETTGEAKESERPPSLPSEPEKSGLPAPPTAAATVASGSTPAPLAPQNPLLAAARTVPPRPLPAPEPEPLDLAPEGLDIGDRELQFVGELGPILSATPRVLKRFANTYRLVKVGLRPEARAAFVADGDTSPYRICMFQMAILVGAPRVARPFLEALTNAPSGGTDKLGDWMERLKDPAVPEWNAVLGWLKDRPAWRALPVWEFAQSASVATRYSFHLATHAI